MSARAAEMLGKPLEDLRMIVMHLGSGSSITAVQGGQSIDTSMGFTPLAGVTMGTRSGDMDGVDVLVFTAGIGENGDEIRDKIMRSLDYLSAKIDNDLNYKSHGVEADLSTADSTVKTLLVPTNEELMIVRDVMALS